MVVIMKLSVAAVAFLCELPSPNESDRSRPPARRWLLAERTLRKKEEKKKKKRKKRKKKSEVRYSSNTLRLGSGSKQQQQ